MSEWQPIETAPKDGTYVLVYCDAGGWMGVEIAVWDGMEDGGRGGWNSNRDCAAVYPTHWMPLPEPPVVGTGNPVSQAVASGSVRSEAP